MITFILIAMFAMLGVSFAALVYAANSRSRAGQRGIHRVDVAAGRPTK
jgi:hypothetical protein